jgi:RimJ/RimL family protein N-acetyltransferase
MGMAKTLGRPIVLSVVRSRDMRFLYDMLKERGDNISISHRAIPSYKEHVAFWASNPYARADIIRYGFGVNSERAGYCYISKQNEIAIHLLPKFQRLGIGPHVMGLLISLACGGSKDVFANINPHNKVARKMLIGLGFKHIQETYRYEP